MKVFLGIMAVLCVLGWIEVVRSVRFRLLRPREWPPVVVELLLENEEECEYQLRAVLERLRWLQVPPTLRVRCRNPRKDPAIDAIVDRFARRGGWIEKEKDE